MPHRVLANHVGLSSHTRIARPLAEHIAAWEWAALIFMGVAAAAVSTLVDLHLRIPGHAILKSLFPMAAGFAVVPRRGAGMVMAGSALVTAIGLRMFGQIGGGFGLGAMSSMVALGLLLDWALRRTKSGWGVYRAFIIAGLASNLIALGTRGGAKWFGWEKLGSRPFGMWIGQAAITYTLCGILAGFISALIWFSLKDREPKRVEEQ